MQESSTNDTTHPAVLAFRQDLEQQLREQVREAIETVLEAELTAALGSGRHERTARRAGYRHGTVDRTLTTRDGVRQCACRGGGSATPTVRRGSFGAS